MALGDKMRLVEKRRGDVEPEPDRLSLSRTLWLDFDGAGYTANDTITGTLHRAIAPRDAAADACSVASPSTAKINSSRTWTRIRARRASRFVKGSSRSRPTVASRASAQHIPAVGYDHDFHEVSATLHIPPGYRLLHASGADEVPGTWVRHWTLARVVSGARALALFRQVVRPRLGRARVSDLHARVPRDRRGALAVGCGARDRSLGARDPGRQSARGVQRPAAGRALDACCSTRCPSSCSTCAKAFIRRSRTSMRAAIRWRAAASSSAQRAKRWRRRRWKPRPRPAAAHCRARRRCRRGRASTRRCFFVGGGVPIIGKTGSSSRARRHGLQAIQRSLRSERDGPDRTRAYPSGVGRPRSVTFSGPVERSQRLHFYFLSPPINLLLALLRAVLLTLLFARLLPFGTARLPGFGRPAAALAALLSDLLVGPRSARGDSHRLAARAIQSAAAGQAGLRAELRVQFAHAARCARQRAARAASDRGERHHRGAAPGRGRAMVTRARAGRRPAGSGPVSLRRRPALVAPSARRARCQRRRRAAQPRSRCKSRCR